ncbi:MAG TPA: hypothetical protein PK228_15665 [Saprospiraceae bacterium]|nr:hypothetical protein [Saprospiraceae bacterium]
MAFLAIHRFVLAFQPETRFIVVKIFQNARHLESLFTVAIRALLPEFVFMRVLVTGDTIIGLHTEAILKNGGRGGIDIMAFGAIHLLVFSFQRKKRLAVVELF